MTTHVQERASWKRMGRARPNTMPPPSGQHVWRGTQGPEGGQRAVGLEGPGAGSELEGG